MTARADAVKQLLEMYRSTIPSLDQDLSADTTQAIQDIISTCDLTRGTLSVTPATTSSALRDRAQGLAHLVDVVVIHNDPVSLAAGGYSVTDRLLAAGWEPEPLATDANRYTESRSIVAFLPAALNTSRRFVDRGWPILYLPTGSVVHNLAWSTRDHHHPDLGWPEQFARLQLSRNAEEFITSDRSVGGRHLFDFEIPVLDKISYVDLLECIEGSPEAYLRFRAEMAKVRALLDAAISRDDMNAVDRIRHDYVYAEVAHLNQQFLRIRREFGKRMALETATVIGFSVAALNTQDIVQYFSAAGAAFRIRDLIAKVVDYQKDSEGLQDNPWWFMWRLMNKRRVPIRELSKGSAR